MNPSTALGIIGGIVIVAVTVAVSVQDASFLWNPLGLLVVLGGTAAATFVAFPLRELRRIVHVFFVVLRNERLYSGDDLNELVAVSRTMLKGDLRAIEKRMKTVRNPFLKLGVQLVLDDAPAQDIIDIMSWRIEKLKAKESAEANMFRSMAAFAPAFGMIGTLLGLVNMLGNLGGSLEEIGANMAVAMMTTLYGIILSSLLFKPIAIKFEDRTKKRVALMSTVIQGVLLLNRRRSPGIVQDTLEEFMAERADEISEPAAEDAQDGVAAQ